MSVVFFWITPRMAVGPGVDSVADVRTLERHGVTDVLDLRAEHDATAFYQGSPIHFLRDPMIDDGRHQPAAIYATGVGFVRAALDGDPAAKVYVHCQAGEYRSPSMAYAVLRSYGMSPADAWAQVLAKHPTANRQYVGSAEAAVPTLAAGIAAAKAGHGGSRGELVVSLLAGAAVAAVGFWTLRRYV